MIDVFRRWFREHKLNLEREGITVALTQTSVGLSKNGVSATLRSRRFEAEIELWESGESEFYLVEMGITDNSRVDEVVVTHHEFRNTAEMTLALGELTKTMSSVLAMR